jgi:hypothetical protein
MISELEYQLDDFSQVNRVQCFLHVVNLVAKSLLKQFKVSNKHGETADAGEQELENLLAELAKDFEQEESVTQALDDADIEMLDDVDDLVDADETLTDAKRAKVKASIHPVTLVLAKVSRSLQTGT